MIVRIISNAHGSIRDKPAGAFRDFYLLTAGDIEQAPKLLPWSLRIDYPMDVRRGDSLGPILGPLGFTRYEELNWLEPDRNGWTKTSPMTQEALRIGKGVSVLVPADIQRHSGNLMYRFFRPWAYTRKKEYDHTGGRPKENYKYSLHTPLEKFLIKSAVWVILNGAKPTSICNVCPHLLAATTGDCVFPKGSCFYTWRKYESQQKSA